MNQKPDFSKDILDRARAVAAAPASLVTGVDVPLAAGDVALDPKDAAQLQVLIVDQDRAYAADIEREDGAARVALLRAELDKRGLDGFVVPMADEHQNEFVPRHAQRLAWLSCFLGSAGTIIVLRDKAAIFVDGRYTLQVRDQVDLSVFDTRSHLVVADWLTEQLSAGQQLGYDPWLHTAAGVKSLQTACDAAGASLVAVETNPLDAVWSDQPPPPLARIVPHDGGYAGEPSADKRARIAKQVSEKGAQALALSATDSIAWLLNVRGADVGRTPLALAYGLLHEDASFDLFVDERKVDGPLRAHLGNQVRILPQEALGAALDALGDGEKSVLVDQNTAPAWIAGRLRDAGAPIIKGADPCQQAKAVKNATELAGARTAHERDGVALVKFLAWLDVEAPKGTVDELTAVERLQAFRAEGDLFRDLSFDTIAGAGPNGAIVHYRVSAETNRLLGLGELFLVDSGAQYLDGTTDVTRTIPIGDPTDEMKDRFTRVLKGHIALARAVFPQGTTGHQLDVLARGALWQAGLDFKHGTGHGVGSYLGVHEGPHNISPRPSPTPLEPGMIVSNEPGYYKEGAYGIRIENLIAVRADQDGEDDEPFYGFETLTLAPIDRRLIETSLLEHEEQRWLNAYHARVFDTLSGDLDGETAAWLKAATAPVD